MSKWLMNEPASMMDFGVYRIERSLDSGNFEDSRRVFVSYNWDEDKIVMEAIHSVIAPFENELAARERCGKWFKVMRDFFLVSNETGEDRAPNLSYFASFFNHQGYVRGRQNEDDFEKNISRKAFLSLTLFFNQDDRPAKMTCSKPLYATSFRFEIE